MLRNKLHGSISNRAKLGVIHLVIPKYATQKCGLLLPSYQSYWNLIKYNGISSLQGKSQYFYLGANETHGKKPGAKQQQLYGHLSPISQTIHQVRWTRHAGHFWRIKSKLTNNVLLWTPTYGHTRVGQSAKTYIH